MGTFCIPTSICAYNGMFELLHFETWTIVFHFYFNFGYLIQNQNLNMVTILDSVTDDILYNYLCGLRLDGRNQYRVQVSLFHFAKNLEEDVDL
jgi:hypothetical protein